MDSEERETLHNELLKKEDFAAALFRTSRQKSRSDSQKMEECRDGPQRRGQWKMGRCYTDALWIFFPESKASKTVLAQSQRIHY